MKRVLLIARPFENSFEGTGEQAVAREIASELKNNYPDIHLDYFHEFLIHPYHNPISLLIYDYCFVAFYAVKSWFITYDVVIFNSGYQTALSWMFLRRKTKKISIIGGFLFMHNTARSAYDRYSAVLYRVAMKFTHPIATTDENKALIKKYYGAEATMIPLGVAERLDFGRPTAKKDMSTVGYIGAYSVRKRPEFLLSLIKSKGSKNLNIVLAGRMGGKFKDDLRRATEVSKANVNVAGEITEEEKVNFYRQLNYLYFPTSWEGFGLPLAEAMRAGVIPIIHRDAIIPAIVKKGCLIVDGPDDVIKTIRLFNKDPIAYEALAGKNYRHARKYFSWANYARYTESLMKSA